MAQLPLPNFETLSKLSGWASEQSAIFLSIITLGPKGYLVSARSSPSVDLLPKSVKFALHWYKACPCRGTGPLIWAISISTGGCFQWASLLDDLLRDNGASADGVN
jgi:hypothetical protein